MPSPFEDPSFSKSDFEFGNTKLTWKSGKRRRGRPMIPFPILILGGILCLGILITFIKASKSTARNDSHLAQVEEPELKVEPNHSAYIPTAPRELPTTIVLPDIEDLPESGDSELPEEPVSLPSPADPELPPPDSEEEVPEMEPDDPPTEAPVVAPAERPEPEVEPSPFPLPDPSRSIPRQRRIGEARFALLNPKDSDLTFLSTRPISTRYFRPYASAKSRAMVPGTYARVTRDEAKDFAGWLTQVHRAKGLIGGNEYYRLPTRSENRSNDSWQNDSGSTSSDRRVFRLALVSERTAGRSISG